MIRGRPAETADIYTPRPPLQPRTEPSESRRGTAALILLLVALAALVCGDTWRNGVTRLSPYSDIIEQHFATKTVLWRSLKGGHGIPFWRADERSGGPAFTNPQSLYTYPLHFLFFLLPPEKAMGPTLWLHFLAAGVVFYVFGGVLKLGRPARFLMAVAGMFNYKLFAIVYAGWLPPIAGVVFVPLLIAAVFRLLEKPGLGSALFVTLSGAICLHTGQLQLFYYATLFLAPYAVIRMILTRRASGRQAAARQAAWLVAGSAVAVGLAAYLLLPMAAEAPLISRGGGSYSYFLSGHALRPAQLASFFTPSVARGGEEFWEDAAYFGILPLLFAVVGAVLGWRRSPTRFLVISFVVTVLLAMDTPLLRAAYSAVPGMSLFRCPCRFLFLSAIFGIGLAGIGADEALVRLRRKWPSPAACGALVALAAAVMTVEAHVHAVDLLAAQPWFGGAAAQATCSAVPPPELRRSLEDLAGPAAPIRVAPIGENTINYGWAAPLGLEVIAGYDPYNLRHYLTFMEILQFGKPTPGQGRSWTDVTTFTPRRDFLEALAVSWIICTMPVRPPVPDFPQERRLPLQPTFAFYEGIGRSNLYVYTPDRARYQPARAYWVERLVGVSDESRMVAEAQKHDLHRTAIVCGAADAVFGDSSRDMVACAQPYDGHLEADVSSRTARFLVFSEVWHPGWRATLDGRPLALARTNIALMGAWIPAGSHKVSLDFRPLWWHLALSITLASAALAAGAAVWIIRKSGKDAKRMI